MAVLEEHRRRQGLERERAGELWDDRGLVFASEVGTPLNPGNLARAYKALIRRPGVPDIRFHDLRHTSASLLIRSGMSVKVVSDRLGHTNTGFTNDTYVHHFDEQREEAALGIADLLGETGGDLN